MSNNSQWLSGYVVFLSGGASGLGLSIAKRFISEGAFLGILDNCPARISEAREILGPSVIIVEGDSRSYDDNRNVVDRLYEKYGKLDVFIGNAGIWDFGKEFKSYSPVELGDTFDEVMSINVKGYLMGVSASIDYLKKSKGAVILTVSNAGFYVDGGGALYTASKHAVVGIIKQLAFEFAPTIRVNGVAPGATVTNLRGPESIEMGACSIQDLPLSEFEGLIPMRSVPDSSEFVGPYVLLSSRENSGMATGSIFNIDGGIGVRGIFSVSKGEEL